jgi:hypothetical protein
VPPSAARTESNRRGSGARERTTPIAEAIVAANEASRRALRAYLRIIEQLAEPDLSGPGFPERSVEAFRVLRLPSLRAIIAVRLELTAAGAVLSRSVGQVQRPGRRETMIDAALIDPIARVWRAPELWRDDRPRQLGLDEETWVLEWRRGEEYRIAESWCRDTGPCGPSLPRPDTPDPRPRRFHVPPTGDVSWILQPKS